MSHAADLYVPVLSLVLMITALGLNLLSGRPRDD